MNGPTFAEQRRFMETSFGRIAYIEQGSGPVTLFIHGLPLCSYQWRDVMADLAPSRRCIAVDLMGLGYSEIAANQDVSFGAQARMLAAFLDAASIESADVVGNDTGGGIGQIFTAMHSTRVHTLTLTNCEVHDLWPNKLLTGFYQGVASGAVPNLMKKMLGDPTLAWQQLGVLVYEDQQTFPAESVQIYLSPIVASEQRIALFQQLCNWETNRAQVVAVAPQLRASKVPAQIIWGDADPVFDVEPSLAWLSSGLGGLRKVTRVPRAKLFFPEEHSRLMSVMLTEFWKNSAG